jgi:hypothetical protein
MEDVKGLVNSLLSDLFKGIEYKESYIQENKLYILFFHGLFEPKQSATMIFDIDNNYFTFNPFISRPHPFEEGGIDWISMKYLKRELVIYTLEQELTAEAKAKAKAKAKA